MARKKTILFGGSFDPVHLAHTTVAVEAIEHIGAEKTVFIPAKCSPLKSCSPKASDDDRMKMITLAIAENKNFELSDCELKKATPSYTLHTVRQLQVEYGTDTLIYWLVGADSIDDFPHWYGIEELIDECVLSIMYRAGYKPPDFAEFKGIWGAERVEKLQKNIIKTSLIGISSTEIRNRLAAELDVSDMLCPAVADYIRKHNLYRAGS